MIEQSRGATVLLRMRFNISFVTSAGPTVACQCDTFDRNHFGKDDIVTRTMARKGVPECRRLCQIVVRRVGGVIEVLCVIGYRGKVGVGCFCWNR